MTLRDLKSASKVWHFKVAMVHMVFQDHDMKTGTPGSHRHYSTVSTHFAAMSSIPPPSFPTLSPPNTTPDQLTGLTPTPMDPINLDYMAGITDTAMADTSIATPMTMEPRGSSTLLPPSRTIDTSYIPPLMYQPPLAYPPVGPGPYTGNGPTGPYANGPNMQAPNTAYARIESVSDLVSPDSLDFEYSPELSAILHTGKCVECVQFGMHIIRPGNRAKFLCATSAHSESSLIPLRTEIAKPRNEALITTKTLTALKDALQSSQQDAALLREQRDKAQKDHDGLLVEHGTLSQRVRDLEQRAAAPPYRQHRSPPQGLCHRSPPRPGARTSTPYERPNIHRMTHGSSRRTPASTPAIMEPESGGDVVMAAMPTSIHPMHMDSTQPRYNNPRPCSAANYRWKADNGIEMIGLPTTRAGTPYLPNDLGLGWYRLENNVTSIDDVHRRIELLFRNRKEEIWRAAARSAYDICCIITPLPEVVEHFLQLHVLRKSVWTIIDQGVANGSDLSIISPGCRPQTDGYAGLYTPTFSFGQ